MSVLLRKRGGVAHWRAVELLGWDGLSIERYRRGWISQGKTGYAQETRRLSDFGTAHLSRNYMTRAFTIIEMLVAVAIVGILLAVAIPVVSAVNKKIDSAKCLENLRAIGVALNVYVADHDHRMPSLAGSRSSNQEDVAVIDTVLAEYVPGVAVFRCPFDAELAHITGTSYGWNTFLNNQPLAGLNFALGDLIFSDKSSIPVLNDKRDWHARRKNFLYADGSAGNHPLNVK